MGRKDDASDRCGPWSWFGKAWAKGAPEEDSAAKGFDPFPRAGGRSRMFGPGDLRLLALALIADSPRHGYELIRLIESRFGGAYAPSPGVIYPTLALLEGQGLVRAESAPGGKRSFSVTAAGLAHLEENRAALDALMTRIDAMAGGARSEAAPPSIEKAAQALRHAVLAKPGGWSLAEETRVRRILEQAAREIVAGAGDG